MKIISDIKYFFSKFEFLRAYWSPFKRPNLRFYIGEIAIGTPIFFPRKWVKFTKEDALEKAKKEVEKEHSIYLGQNPETLVNQFINYQKAIPKKIGFNFVSLGWKTKYDDYRFEWSPVWSFVFFKWQTAIIFVAPETDHYWECWLSYRDTNKNLPTKERIALAKDENPCVWSTYKGEVKETVCYWDLILKDKWL